VVQRTLDARRLTEIANHPDVRPWLLGEGEIDLTATISEPRNVALEARHGGVVSTGQGYGRYEVHSMFHPERPAPETRDAMVAGLEYMFTATDAQDIVTT